MTEIDEATALWRQAFEGEVLGAALFARMRDLTDDEERRRKIEVLRRLEQSTTELLRPVLAAKGISTDGEAEAAAHGASLASAAAEQPWHDLLESLEPSTAVYAASYARLRTLVPEADHPVVDALLAHERALCSFATLELAGDPHPEAPILALPHVD
jgi:hypothetical protein